MGPRLAGLLQPWDIKGRRSAVFFQVVLLFCVNTVSKRRCVRHFVGGLFWVQCNLSRIRTVLVV